MLINSLRLYERILQGFDAADQDVRDAADTCLSFLIPRLRSPQIVLPPEVEERLNKLPSNYL